MKTALSLFLLALVIRLAAIWFWQFDGLYGQDAFAYFDQAVAIAQNLPQGQPPPADFFWPNGYPGLIAFGMLFLGQSAWAGQVAALLCGSALAPLAYLLSTHLGAVQSKGKVDQPPAFDNKAHQAGVLAGLMIAAAGQPILSSIVVMADMPALFWAALAVWLTMQATKMQSQKRSSPENRPGTEDGRPSANTRSSVTGLPLSLVKSFSITDDALSAHEGSSVFWFLGAGAALAMAIISRWLYLLMVIPLGLYVLFKVLQKKLIWWQIWPAAVSGSIVLAPQVWLSLNKPEGLFHSWLLGWNLTNFFQREFENIDGHFIYQLPNAIFYAQPAGHPAYIFPLLGLAGLWGLWRLWQTRQWETLILLLGWILPSYLFLAGIPYQNFRFGLTHYLPWALLTGFGVSDLLSTSITKQGGRGAGGIFSSAPALRAFGVLPCSPAVLKITIALSLVSMLAWAYPMLNSFLTSQNQSKVIARQVEQNLPPQATLITFGLTLTIQHYTPLNTVEIFHQDSASLQKMAETHTPLYLLLDVNSIQTQWEGKTPQLNYQWLKENIILQKVGVFPPYTLFKVSKPE